MRLNLTKVAIESLPIPEKGWKYHYDTKVRGLAIGIGASGAMTFILYRKVDGRPERIKLGPYPDLTIELARKQAEKVNAQIALGHNPSDEARGRRAEMTFGELFEMYIERHAKPHKKTWREDQAKFDQYMTNRNQGICLATKRLSNVTRRDIATLHNKITKEKPTTANRVLSLVSSVFGRAIEWGLWESANPAIGVKHNREQSRDRFLQQNEMPRFFAAVADEPNESLRDYFTLLLFTGVRRSNLLKMQWAEIDLDRAEWRIPITKNGEPQLVPLSPEAIKILRSRISDESPFVFPGRGAKGHMTQVEKGWNRIKQRAGFTNLRIHDLRRTLGSWQARTGASLTIIGKSLNHKDPKTTAIYARLDIDPVRSSVNTANAAIVAAASAVG